MEFSEILGLVGAFMAGVFMQRMIVVVASRVDRNDEIYVQQRMAEIRAIQKKLRDKDKKESKRKK
jgi:hypothetical protein